MLYTAAPSTWPAGSNPTLLIAANSSVVSADPQVPLALISASLARAAGGRSCPGCCVVTYAIMPAPRGRENPRPLRVAVLRVPLLVAAPHGLQRPGRVFPGRIRAEPPSPGAARVRLHRVMLQAEPPVLGSVHAN